jgi:hypothetical protein
MPQLPQNKKQKKLKQLSGNFWQKKKVKTFLTFGLKAKIKKFEGH